MACEAVRLSNLAASLPCRTDEETLAALDEIRARYVKALRLAEDIWIGGRRIAGHLRSRLGRIDREYDAKAGGPGARMQAS